MLCGLTLTQSCIKFAACVISLPLSIIVMFLKNMKSDEQLIVIAIIIQNRLFAIFKAQIERHHKTAVNFFFRNYWATHRRFALGIH